MENKVKKDGTTAKKPGRKPAAQPAAKPVVTAEPKAFTVRTAQDTAWARIHELAHAMQQEKDEKTVEKWAYEITWQCSIIGAVECNDRQAEAGH